MNQQLQRAEIKINELYDQCFFEKLGSFGIATNDPQQRSQLRKLGQAYLQQAVEGNLNIQVVHETCYGRGLKTASAMTEYGYTEEVLDTVDEFLKDEEMLKSAQILLAASNI